MIALIDYGLGNIQAFANIYRRLNIPAVIASTPETLDSADKLVLPGVGAFDWAMERLVASGMRECLDELVQERKVPVLGVCVGMQMLSRRSEEGKLPGLGWIDGEVRRFDDTRASGKPELPHMGWNDVRSADENDLFRGMEAPRFYFLHSYYVEVNDPDDVLAVADYYGTFTASVRHGNVLGTQFHPEKSHHWGVQLLKNFAELT